jgi:RNA polymerase sigma-32 factor
MAKDGKRVPHLAENENRNQSPENTGPQRAADLPAKPVSEQRAKPFVRIPVKKKTPVKANASPTSAPKKTQVVEAEIVDDDVEENDSSGERVFEGEVEFGENLPALLDSETARTDALLEEDDEALEKKASAGADLVVSSALQRYLAELRKYPLMTVEEEREVARKAHEQNDLQARNRLITSNLRLVVKIAMEYRRAYSQILDLIQEGNAGLVQAVNRFNPYLNVKLSTYSAWWIRAYILKFLMDNKSMVRMGTTDAQRKLFFRLRSEAEKMYALTQRFDTQLLAENIGVKESDVIEMHQRLSKNDLSLDSPVREDSDTRHVDTLVADIPDPDVAAERGELLAILRAKVGEIENELNERDAYIFRERILADEPVTLQDVGDKFGITRERARQLESRVMKKIKEVLLDAGLGQEDEM